MAKANYYNIQIRTLNSTPVEFSQKRREINVIQFNIYILA